jgi:hypothetical protein
MSRDDLKPCVELGREALRNVPINTNCNARESWPSIKLKPLPPIEAGARKVANQCLPPNREWCYKLAIQVLKTLRPNYVLSIINEARGIVEAGSAELALAYLAHALGYSGYREATGVVSVRQVGEPSGVVLDHGELTIDLTPLHNGAYTLEMAGAEFGPFTIEPASPGLAGVLGILRRLLGWR